MANFAPLLPVGSNGVCFQKGGKRQLNALEYNQQVCDTLTVTPGTMVGEMMNTTLLITEQDTTFCMPSIFTFEQTDAQFQPMRIRFKTQRAKAITPVQYGENPGCLVASSTKYLVYQWPSDRPQIWLDIQTDKSEIVNEKMILQPGTNPVLYEQRTGIQVPWSNRFTGPLDRFNDESGSISFRSSFVLVEKGMHSKVYSISNEISDLTPFFQRHSCNNLSNGTITAHEIGLQHEPKWSMESAFAGGPKFLVQKYTLTTPLSLSMKVAREKVQYSNYLLREPVSCGMQLNSNHVICSVTPDFPDNNQKWPSIQIYRKGSGCSALELQPPFNKAISNQYLNFTIQEYWQLIGSEGHVCFGDAGCAYTVFRNQPDLSEFNQIMNSSLDRPDFSPIRTMPSLNPPAYTPPVDPLSIFQRLHITEPGVPGLISEWLMWTLIISLYLSSFWYYWYQDYKETRNMKNLEEKKQIQLGNEEKKQVQIEEKSI